MICLGQRLRRVFLDWWHLSRKSTCLPLNPEAQRILRERLQTLEHLLVRGAEPLGREFAAGAVAGQTINIFKPQRYITNENLKGQIRGAGSPMSGTDSAACGQSCSPTASGSLGEGNSYRPSVRVSLDVPADNSFATALAHLFNGGKAARAGWNGAGQHVFAKWPDKLSMMSAPYLVLRNVQGDLVPWVPSQGDIFARDWALLPTDNSKNTI